MDAPGGEKRYLPIQDRRRNIVALYDTEAFTLTALADYTAQGHRTALDSSEAVVCEEEGTGAICESLGGAFPFGFNTAWRSSRTGLYAMRHRWYSPTLGEFLSHDPLEEVDSFNLYAFAAHDPINSWDPYGLRSRSNAPEPQDSGCGFWQRCDVMQGMERPVEDFGSDRAPPLNEAYRTPIGQAVEEGNKRREEADEFIESRRRAVTKHQKRVCLADVACHLTHEMMLEVFPEDMNDVYLGAALGVAGPAVGGLGRKVGRKVIGKGLKPKVKVPKKTGKKPSAPAPGAKCFVAGTAVLLATGAFNPIEQLEVQAQVALQERHPEEQVWRSIQGPSGRLEVAPGVELTLKRGEVIEVSLAAHREPERERWQSLKASRYVPGSLHATDITPALWRRLTLELERPDGSLAEVELIRPLWWLEQTGAAQGGTIHLEVTEAGLAGKARILSLSDDVTVDSRTAYGAIVTGTIFHRNAQVLSLVFDGEESQALGVTPSHPLYSADRGEYVEAGELVLGERVARYGGTTSLVTSMVSQRADEPVYNLEVHRAQSYYVGEQELLAHNTGTNCQALRKVGDLLESVEDVMANPSLLDGKSMNHVKATIGESPGWSHDVMRRSTRHPNGGWVFREMNKKGTDYTGRMIQWHPGTPRHFKNQPYWKVSNGKGGTTRYPAKY